MVEWLLTRAAPRLRPPFGWLAFLLLLGALLCLILSVLAVEWVPEDGVVAWTVLTAFLLATALAHRGVSGAAAWAVLLLAGAALTMLLVGELLPPSSLWQEGAAETLARASRQSALLADRVAGWWRAVSGGGRSTETVVFALGLGYAGWLVAAFLAWSSYRLARPYWGLTLVAVSLAANTFYGQAPLYWAILFFGQAITAAAYLNYLQRETEWERRGVDYSPEVRLDLLFYTAGISLGIMSLAMALPSINFRALAEAFQRQEAVVEAEQTLSRAFAGIQRPRTDEGALGAGGLPRAFLLGGDPALSATVVMTATVRPESDNTAALSAHHWRSVSYDVYTGRGWRRSPEREEPLDAGQPIPAEAASPEARFVTVDQSVEWLYDRRTTRYTLGRPVVFNHDLAVQWRGSADLVGVRGRNNAPPRYVARSRLLVPDPAALATARLEATPPEILARYTALPDDVPPRVVALAREAAGLSGNGPAPPPYEQARAIEAFLHQYPYTLDLPTPPGDVELVDYFLFDLQRGFCDYFATAMVIMARAVGLPARLGVGFMQQPPDGNGVQTVRQIDAHSWAEVYFNGYGWVEFEPTPGVTPAVPAAAGPTDSPVPTYTPPNPPTVTMPPRAPQRETPWAALLGLTVLAIVAWRLWGRGWLARRRAPRPALDDVQAAFAGLQEGAAALGYAGEPGHTPAEFAGALIGRLEAEALAAEERAGLAQAVERLAQIFGARQYGRARSPEATAEAGRVWARARSVLRQLRRRRLLRRAGK